jgi:hypothetical protein
MLVANSAGAETRLDFNATKVMLEKNLNTLIRMHHILISGHVPTYPPQVGLTVAATVCLGIVLVIHHVDHELDC